MDFHRPVRGFAWGGLLQLRSSVSALPMLRPAMRLDLCAVWGALWMRGALWIALRHLRKSLAGAGTVAELRPARLLAEFAGAGPPAVPLTPQNRGFCRRRSAGV